VGGTVLEVMIDRPRLVEQGLGLGRPRYKAYRGEGASASSVKLSWLVVSFDEGEPAVSRI